MAATLDLTQFNTVWDESFDNGTGMLSRNWGPGIDTSVAGQITIRSTPDNQDSGAMVPPWGAATSGYGYGLFSFTLSMGQGNAPGPYALLWPGTDVWPGPELDLVELLPGGQAYSTIHWKGADGSNQFQSYNLDGVDVKQTHTYSLDWQAGRLSMYVDGVQKWTTTEHVPADAAHGGENEAPGIGMQTWWSADAQHGSGYDNSITLYDVQYAAANSTYTGGTGGSGGGSNGGGANTTPGDIAPAAKFGLVGSYAKTAWEGHTTFDGADYHTFGATGAWNNTPAVLMAPAAWNPAFASKLAFDNFVQANIDLHAAGTQALDVMLVSAKRGAVTLGDGNDHLTWVAHSNGAGAALNTTTIKTGAGDDVVKVTAAGLSSLADYDRFDNGSLYNASYDGRHSIADVTFGAGKDSVTVEGMAKLVLHAGSGAATAVGGGGNDLFDAGTGTGNFTGGAGKDIFAFNAHDGHAVIQDFTAGVDKLKFTGLTSADISTKAATEGGVSGLLVTYDTAGDSVFLAHVTKLAAADMMFA